MPFCASQLLLPPVPSPLLSLSSPSSATPRRHAAAGSCRTPAPGRPAPRREAQVAEVGVDEILLRLLRRGELNGESGDGIHWACAALAPRPPPMEATPRVASNGGPLANTWRGSADPSTLPLAESKAASAMVEISSCTGNSVNSMSPKASSPEFRKALLANCKTNSGSRRPPPAPCASRLWQLYVPEGLGHTTPPLSSEGDSKFQKARKASSTLRQLSVQKASPADCGDSMFPKSSSVLRQL